MKAQESVKILRRTDVPAGVSLVFWAAVVMGIFWLSVIVLSIYGAGNALITGRGKFFNAFMGSFPPWIFPLLGLASIAAAVIDMAGRVLCCSAPPILNAALSAWSAVIGRCVFIVGLGVFAIFSGSPDTAGLAKWGSVACLMIEFGGTVAVFVFVGRVCRYTKRHRLARRAALTTIVLSVSFAIVVVGMLISVIFEVSEHMPAMFLAVFGLMVASALGLSTLSELRHVLHLNPPPRPQRDEDDVDDDEPSPRRRPRNRPDDDVDRRRPPRGRRRRYDDDYEDDDSDDEDDESPRRGPRRRRYDRY